VLALAVAACGSRGTSGASAPSAPPHSEKAHDAACRAPKDAPRAAAPLPAEPRETSGPIAAVELRGIVHADAAAVQRAIKSKMGAPCDAETVRADVRRLWATGEIEDVDVRVDATAAGVTLTYVVSERPRVGEVHFDGAKVLDEAALARALDTARGDHFDRSRVFAGMQAVRELYVERGYRRVGLELRTRDAGGGALDACVVVTEGPKATIARWDFVGNAQVDEDKLRWQMATEDGLYNSVGGVYRGDLWERDKLMIIAHYYDLGFLTVEMDEPEVTESADGRALSVTVRIREGAIYKLGKLRVIGALAAPEKDYLAQLTAHEGDVFRRAVMIEELARLRAFHKDTTGKEPEVEPATELHPDTKTVDVTFNVAK